jgi:hypothetical protein
MRTDLNENFRTSIFSMTENNQPIAVSDPFTLK